MTEFKRSGSGSSRLLIAPEGIEMKGYLNEPEKLFRLLIAPEGIEMKIFVTGQINGWLLIAPEGIEIQ